MVPAPPPEAAIQTSVEPRPRPLERADSTEDAPLATRNRDEDDFDVTSLRSPRGPVTVYVLPPAILLIIVALLSIAFNMLQAVLSLADPEMVRQNNANFAAMFGQQNALPADMPILSAIAGIVFALMSVGVLAGAFSMMRQKY